MAKGEKQKQKQLLLMDIFMQMTDDDHKLTLAEITALLKNAGANADRKTLYDDFRVLEDYGLNIEKAKIGSKTYYWLASRNFEITDVKLLIDAVQSSKFISESRSKELIEKLESLVSVHEAKELSRQVVTAGRIKTMNSSSYYNVDTLYHAINNNNQVKFKYFAWNFDGEKVFKRDNSFYQVSPICLIWDEEKYYLAAYEDTEPEGIIKKYRVDKMTELEELSDCKRPTVKEIENFDMVQYSNKLFGMFSGETAQVTLEADNELANVIVDRFGSDITTYACQENTDKFCAVVEVDVCNQFLGWIISLGPGIKITSPPKVVDQIKSLLDELGKQYE